MCSTPFGVRGRITPKIPPTCVGRSRAQRLSASEDGSRFAWTTDRDGDRCSTPFGVRGRITGRCNSMRSPDPCAQRLSASEDGSPSRPAKRTLSPCTCSTPFGVRGRITGHSIIKMQEGYVLNAFRRQRTDHPNTPTAAKTLLLCSTPFGVRGRITWTRRA